MWDDDETTEGGEVPPDSAVKPTSDQGLARESMRSSTSSTRCGSSHPRRTRWATSSASVPRSA